MNEDYIALVKEEFALAAEVAGQLLREQLAARETTGLAWPENVVDTRRAVLMKAALDAAGISLVRTH